MEETGRIHHRREPNRSSMATYSAVTRVSRSACTRPPCPRRFSNDDSRHPHHFKPPSLNSEVFIWLGDRAVGGVALGGDEVGRRVGPGAAAEAVRARPAGEPVVASGAEQGVV